MTEALVLSATKGGLALVLFCNSEYLLPVGLPRILTCTGVRMVQVYDYARLAEILPARTVGSGSGNGGSVCCSLLLEAILLAKPTQLLSGCCPTDGGTPEADDVMVGIIAMAGVSAWAVATATAQLPDRCASEALL